MRAFRLALAGVASMLSLPAHAERFVCPQRGGDAWREVRSAHLVLQTDLPSGKARELGGELERMLEVIRHGLFPGRPPELARPLRVYAFRSGIDLFARKDAAAFYFRAEGEDVVVLPGRMAEEQRILIAHELTHHLAALVFARQPIWFAEGLATFMESIAQYSADTTPTLGGVPKHRYRLVFPYHGGVRRVLAARGSLKGDRSYEIAWALVHYLVNREPQRLAELQLRFLRGADPDAAWREVFPSWDPADPKAMERLDGEIGRYLARGEFRYRDVHLPSPPPLTERLLSSADAHAIRLSLPWFNRGEPAPEGAFLAEVEETLREDPGNPVALDVKARQQGADAPALARLCVTAHPEDVRAWLFLARALPRDDATGREAALRRAVEVDPANPLALNDLAWELLVTGRSGEALPLARRAAALAPGDADILDTFAGVLEDLGQCREALAVQHRARDVLPEGASEKVRAALEERLARLVAACGPAREAEAPPAPAAAAPAATPTR